MAHNLHEQGLVDTSARRAQQAATRRLASLFDPQDRATSAHRLTAPVYEQYNTVRHDFHNTRILTHHMRLPVITQEAPSRVFIRIVLDRVGPMLTDRMIWTPRLHASLLALHTRIRLCTSQTTRPSHHEGDKRPRLLDDRDDDDDGGRGNH